MDLQEYRDKNVGTEPWIELHKRWGALNGIKPCAPWGPSSYPHRILGITSKEYQSRKDDCHFRNTWEYLPVRRETWFNDKAVHEWMDHSTHYKAGKEHIGFVFEPYVPRTSIAWVKSQVEPMGFKLHLPPNEVASFWNPGSCYFLVITSKEFGEVKWLPEQLEYKGNNYK